MKKIKNVSKKIIGNQNFRLLPGETMEVQGDELWVKSYLEDKKLEVISEVDASKSANVDESADENEKPGDDEASVEESPVEEPPAKSGRGRKGSSAE